MKHSTLLRYLAAGVLLLPATGMLAKGSESHPLAKENNPFYTGEAKTITYKGKTYNLGNVYGEFPKTRVSMDDVITKVEGREQLYEKESAGTALLGNQMILYADEFPATVVWGENNEVYVKDIFSTAISDTYVKGTFDPATNLITFKTGQVVEYIEGDEIHQGYGIGLGIGRTEIMGQNVDFYYDPSFTEFSMEVYGEGSIRLIVPGEQFNGEDPTDYVLCLYYMDEDRFTGFSDFMQIYTPRDYSLVSMPEGIEPEQYVYIDDFDYASFVYVAFTDDYLYIQGLDPMLPEGVVKAKIDGNTASIAQNQYMGVYMDMFFIFTKIWYDNPNYNPIKDDDRNAYIMAPPSAVFTLTFDRETGKIVSENKGTYLSFQPDENSFANSNCFLEEFVLTYQNTSAGVPSNPTGLRYLDQFIGYQGFSDFQFHISNYSVEGTLLDMEGIYYSVYANGEPIIFMEQEMIKLNGQVGTIYKDVPPPGQIWLPFFFNNNDDVFKLSVNEFDLGIYVPDVQTLGVQTLYRHEGVITYSDIVTMDVKTGQITTTPAGVNKPIAGDVVKTEYYTLDGTKVENPGKGLFIKKLTFSDGNVVVSKHLIR